MRRDLLRRITRLETSSGHVRLPKFVLVTNSIAREQRESIAAGERIVIDWVNDVDGFVNARERITTDPADEGRRCEPIVTWSRRISWRD